MFSTIFDKLSLAPKSLSSLQRYVRSFPISSELKKKVPKNIAWHDLANYACWRCYQLPASAIPWSTKKAVNSCMSSVQNVQKHQRQKNSPKAEQDRFRYPIGTQLWTMAILPHCRYSHFWKLQDTKNSLKYVSIHYLQKWFSRLWPPHQLWTHAIKKGHHNTT